MEQNIGSTLRPPTDLETVGAELSELSPSKCAVTAKWSKARASLADGACVEVVFDETQVHVRNSRFPERVIDVSRGHWGLLVAGAQAIGQVRLTDWFPAELYGDFAASFYRYEEEAFESGVLGHEAQLVGSD